MPLGLREVAREALAWLPRTPGVTYVRARLRVDEGRYDDAADAMEVLAGSFGELDVFAPLRRALMPFDPVC